MSNDIKANIIGNEIKQVSFVTYNPKLPIYSINLNISMNIRLFYGNKVSTSKKQYIIH